MSFLRETPDGVEIKVKVVPGASRDRIVGPMGDALKIQVAAPPEKGRANAAVISLLAKRLGVSASAVTVLRGHTAPRKVLLARGMNLGPARAALDTQ